MRPLVTAALVLLALPFGASEARAQLAIGVDAAQFTYARPAGKGCVSEQAFRGMVAASLNGRDPFVEDASRHISVTLSTAKRGGFVGVAEEYDAAGRSLGKREMTGWVCAGLTGSMGAVVTSWLFSVRPKVAAPPVVARCAPAEEKARVAVPAPMCMPVVVRVPVPVAPAAAPRPRVVVELGSLMSLATVPRRPGFGLVGGVGLRWATFSLGVEARVDLPSVTAPLGTTAGPASDETRRPPDGEHPSARIGSRP